VQTFSFSERYKSPIDIIIFGNAALVAGQVDVIVLNFNSPTNLMTGFIIFKNGKKLFRNGIISTVVLFSKETC